MKCILLYLISLGLYIRAEIHDEYSNCLVPIIIPWAKLVSVANLTGITVSLTFMLHECGIVDNFATVTYECVIAEYMGREINYAEHIPRCDLKDTIHPGCKLNVTYSDELNIEPWEEEGIQVWTNGTTITILSFNCDFNKSIIPQILEGVNSSFAWDGLGMVYPRSIPKERYQPTYISLHYALITGVAFIIIIGLLGGSFIGKIRSVPMRVAPANAQQW